MSPQLLDIGRIVRPHGLRGHVVVELWTNRDERMATGSVLNGSGDDRFTVTSASPLPESGGRARWLVVLDGVDTVEGAEALRNTVLRAEAIDVEGALWVHELVGASVFDDSGANLGTVEAVEANPASDLLVLDDGRVIPLTFVVAHEHGRLTVEGPPGLLDP